MAGEKKGNMVRINMRKEREREIFNGDSTWPFLIGGMFFKVC